MRRIPLNLRPEIECAEHGTHGALPCAWPGCPNGLEEEEFEHDSPVKLEKPRTYRRRAWQSPLGGGSYYSWQSDHLPNWFHVTQTFWNEARRHQLINSAVPTTVYHYTSLEGLIGIVESRSVWMTEFGYLNDRREVRYGVDLLLNTLRQMLQSATEDNVQRLLSTWIARLEGTTNRVCITSFSADGDSLSQWRAYGPIAIGLPVHSLALHVDQSRFQPVEYDPDIQEKLIQVYVSHLVAAFAADVQDQRLECIPDVYHRSDRLLELAVFFKDPAFKTENEYRLAYIDYAEVLNSLGVSSPRKSFRVSNGRIVPYVPSTDVLGSEHREFPLEISEVILGPESDELLEGGVREFLNEKGLPNVQVRKSLVPLRA